MDKVIFDQIDDLKRLVRVLIPSVTKKKYIQSTSSLFMTYITELENNIKNTLI